MLQRQSVPSTPDRARSAHDRPGPTLVGAHQRAERRRDGFQITTEAQHLIIAKRVEAVLAATPAREFDLLELLVIDANLPGVYVQSIRRRLITPDRELVPVSGEEEAAVYKVTRRTEPANYTVVRYDDRAGSRWLDKIDVNVAALAETFVRLRTTLATLRQDQLAAAAESTTIEAATALVGEQVRAELISTGMWPMLKQRNPLAVKWFTSADFATWVIPFCTRLASADGLRAWLTTRAQAEASH